MINGIYSKYYYTVNLKRQNFVEWGSHETLTSKYLTLQLIAGSIRDIKSEKVSREKSDELLAIHQFSPVKFLRYMII